MNRSKTPFSNIYKEFKYHKEKNMNDILKSTKCLIASSKRYNDYTKDYLNTIHVNSFKQPEIESYPVLRNHDIIPISKRTFDFSSKGTRNYSSGSTKQTITLSPSSTPTPILLTERKYYEQKHKVAKTNPNRQSDVKLKKNLLRDMIFNEPYYMNMTYDESHIFHKEAIYVSYIKKKVEEFKLQKCENLSTEVSRNFNNNTIMLKYNSMKLEFVNLTDIRKRPIVFDIPFAYLPLFYFKEFDNIKYLLLAVIGFNKGFDKIDFNEDGIYQLLKTSIEYKTNDLDMPSSEWNWRDIQSNLEEIDYNGDNIFKKKVIDGSPRIIIKDKHKPEEFVKILSSKFNIYQKLWITPKYNYQFQFKMPSVTLSLPQYKKEIKKTVDPELVIFLLHNNFSHWDFYIANYLISLKSFRWIIERTISKARFLNYKVFDNSKRQINEEMMKHISIKTFNGYEYVNLTKKRIKTPNEREKEFQFYQTDDNLINNIFILRNYSVNVYSQSMKSNKEFHFSFDFNQMRILNAISKHQNLITFMNKILVTNQETDTITLKYDIFDDLNIDNITKEIKIEKLGSTTMKEKDLVITIIYPFIEKIEFMNQYKIHPTTILTDTSNSVHKVVLGEVLDELCQANIEQWAAILCTVRGNNKIKTSVLNLSQQFKNRDKINLATNKSSSRRFVFKDNMML